VKLERRVGEALAATDGEDVRAEAGVGGGGDNMVDTINKLTSRLIEKAEGGKYENNEKEMEQESSKPVLIHSS
jgi:hypothetical protein